MIEIKVGTAQIIMVPDTEMRELNGSRTETYSYGDLLMAIRRTVAAMEPGEATGKQIRINNLLDDLKAVTG